MKPVHEKDFLMQTDKVEQRALASIKNLIRAVFPELSLRSESKTLVSV